MSIGEKIKALRKSKFLTQQEFAEKICITQSHLSRVERGNENLSKTAIKLMCIVFEVELKGFID